MDRVALQKCSYGMYIVCAAKDGRLNGQIVNTVFQITSEPPTVSVSINKQNMTHEYIQAGKAFTVSILPEETPMPFIGLFGFKSGRDIDKLATVKYKIGATGAPIVLDNTLSYLECEVVGSMDVGTHTIFIGKIVDAVVLREGIPMTYEYYHRMKGGKSPKNAPTYVKEENVAEKSAEKTGGTMAKYVCTICGYVYDPEQGDPASGVKPGTSFENIPDTWVCPICGAPKTAFEKTA
jgi:flavin reductase (DIM6/NTAB) family NADH-FMN oxidoreductase RutF/rubredoxin